MNRSTSVHRNWCVWIIPKIELHNFININSSVHHDSSDNNFQLISITRSLVSMEIKLISCPLCLHPRFNDVDTLRLNLVNLTTSSISCPVCAESFLGLEKFTEHLFDHVSERNDSKEVWQNEIDKRIDSISESQRTDERVQPTPEGDVVKCDICNFSFTDK